jgi:hypothetical protein
MTTSLRKGAVAKVACTHCKSQPGEPCKTTSGKVLELPHVRREWDLMHMPGFSMQEYQQLDGVQGVTPRRGPGYE